MKGSDILKSVTENTDSGLILFFVILAVVIIVAFPSVLLYFKHKTNKTLEAKFAEQKNELDKIRLQAGLEGNQFNQWTEREKNLLQVIKENGEKSEKVAEAISKLSTVLAINNQSCDSCKTEQVTLWREVKDELRELRVQVERRNSNECT